MLCDIALSVGLFQEPLLRSVGVCGGLSCCEGFGGDQEESGLWVRVVKGFRHMGSIDVGDKVEGLVSVAIIFEGFSDHDGAAARFSALEPETSFQTYRSEPPMPMLMIVVRG